MSDHLFTLPSDAFAVTSDDCYTPRWIFDAMGLEFDLDVAAPPGGPWHVPAKRYYTAEDDGLTSPWDGLVWCNPPYSSYWEWADLWMKHPTGVLLGYHLPQVRWTRPVFASADVVTFTCAGSGGGGGGGFIQPDGNIVRLRQPVFVAFRGVGTEPAERLAAADPYGAVLYGSARATLGRVEALADEWNGRWIRDDIDTASEVQRECGQLLRAALKPDLWASEGGAA